MRADQDTVLARRAAAGDGAAFALLYDRHERRAYNLCYRITGSADDAADATQETFL
jgi:RNA polymerase sigma-70 factor (ECF subfamily)